MCYITQYILNLSICKDGYRQIDNEVEYRQKRRNTGNDVYACMYVDAYVGIAVYVAVGYISLHV